jgi:hypothetical protein
MRRWLLIAFVSSLLPLGAVAQDDPEAGLTASEPPPPAPEPKASPSFSEGWETPPSDEDEDEDDKDEGPPEDSDHAAVVGSFSLGLLGLAELPVALGDPVNIAPGTRTVTSDTVRAPIIGSRYWLNERFGLEAGVGLSFASGSFNTGVGSAVDGGKVTAFAAHVGAPIAATWGKHYALLLTPYIAFGRVSSEDSRATTATGDDVFGTGFSFEGGLKGGVELQLGAVGLEGLALQLTAGLRLRYESRTANVPTLDVGSGVASEIDIESSRTVFETSPGSSLGSAVAGTLAALYYF